VTVQLDADVSRDPFAWFASMAAPTLAGTDQAYGAFVKHGGSEIRKLFRWREDDPKQKPSHNGTVLLTSSGSYLNGIT